MKITQIALKDIIPDEMQPRKLFDELQIEDLAKSIRQYGLLQPILVKNQGDKYVIIAGERRYRACKLLNLEYVDAIIKDDENIMQIALVENIQRENLTTLEEAIAIQNLRDKFGYTHDELSKMLGKTRVYITNKLRILNADNLTKKMLEDNKISEGHARALLGERDVRKRQELARKILEKGLSVREVESRVKKQREEPNVYDNLIELLEDKLGTRVHIEGDSEQGKISIDFYSIEQLNNLVDLIVSED